MTFGRARLHLPVLSPPPIPGLVMIAGVAWRGCALRSATSTMMWPYFAAATLLASGQTNVRARRSYLVPACPPSLFLDAPGPDMTGTIVKRLLW